MKTAVEYTPNSIWDIMVSGSEDPDENMDVVLGVGKLPTPQRIYIVLLSQGYTGAYAMRKAGLNGNSTRLRRTVLQSLAQVINEGS